MTKVQKYRDMQVHIVGTDLSSAFDTIDRVKLLDILEPLISADELRMVKCLLADTTLELKMYGVETEKFHSNVGSP